MSEDNDAQNSSNPFTDQSNDQILDIPELPEEPQNIVLDDTISTKPEIVKVQNPIENQKIQNNLNIPDQTKNDLTLTKPSSIKPLIEDSDQNILPQTQKEPIKPLISEPHNIVKTSSNEWFESEERISPEVTQKLETPQVKPSKLKIIMLYVGFAIFSVIFVYIFMNFPAIYSKISYKLFGKNNNLKQFENNNSLQGNEDLLFLSTVFDHPYQKYLPSDLSQIVAYPNNDQLFDQTNFGYSDMVDNELVINKIGVRAPVVWDVATEDSVLMENLKYGLVHYKGTAKPGEMSGDGMGNVFIAGHSSYYWWDDGKYKTIFANLDGLSNGDEIVIKYKNYYFLYKVIDKKTVNPDEVGVLAQNTSKPTLTLMTCVPVGTDAQRLIVTSELVGIGKVN